jgi:hypothetical protein
MDRVSRLRRLQRNWKEGQRLLYLGLK